MNDAFQAYGFAAFQLSYGMAYGLVCCCRVSVTRMSFQSREDLLETYC